MGALRFLLGSLRYPQSRSLGFPRMGLGIESRAQRLGPYWSPHLAQCQSLQREWCSDSRLLERLEGSAEEQELMILGAGRLYDCELAAIGRKFRRIRLIDADPLCRSFWKRAAEKYPHLEFQPEITELSGVLNLWQQRLEGSNRLARWDSALEEIRTVVAASCGAPTFTEGSTPSAVLSLNVLSQIPIVWQDCVERVLIRHHGKRLVKQKSAEWLQALLPGAQFLVKQHLALLSATNAASIMLLTDLEYAHYSGPRRYTVERPEAPPVVWRRNDLTLELGGRWIENRAAAPIRGKKPKLTTCEVLGALYGVDLENPESRTALVPGYDSQFVESWLWHIQPQGLEDSRRGTIHRVGAFVFYRQMLDRSLHDDLHDAPLYPQSSLTP